jgi:hypothetical protein
MVERVLVSKTNFFWEGVWGTTRSVCGGIIELVKAENADTSCGWKQPPNKVMVLLTAGGHGVTCAATQGWRRRFRPSSIV